MIKNKNRRKIIIITLLISFAIFIGVYLKTNMFSNNIENPEIDEVLLPDVPTNWYKDYTYTKDDDAKKITLTKYNGSDTEVYVPNTATISSKAYSVIISGGVYRDKTSITSIEFESGVRAGTSLSHLFDGCTSLTNVNFNGMTTGSVTNMSYMFYDTQIEDLDISSFKTTNIENMLYMFDAPIKRIKFGNFDFKITDQKRYPFGRGTWVREEDGQEYAAVDLVRDSSSRDISGTYRKVRNIIDEMSIPGSVTYRLGEIAKLEDFTTTNTTNFGFTNEKFVYLKKITPENKDSLEISGSASVIAKNVVSDINDNKYHLKITLSDVKIYDLKTVSDVDSVYVSLLKITSLSRLALSNHFFSTLTNLRNNENQVLSKTSLAMTVKLEILDQNNEPVTGNYLFSATDIDTPSPRNSDGLPSYADGEGYGSSSEGVRLLEGYDIDSLKLYSRTFLKVTSNNRIYGTHLDKGTELSEMVIKADATKFRFRWTGNYCSTVISSVYQAQTVEIIKQDENGAIIPGAQLSLYDNSNNLVSTWTTTSEPKLFFLNPGKYTLKEDTTPEGYEKSNDIEFYIDTDGSIVIEDDVVDKVRMTDNFKKYSYTVNYLDKDTNEPIHDPKTANAKYTSKIKATDEVINISHYRYHSPDKAEMTIGLSGNIMNLYYNRIRGGIVEKHIDENTGAILYEEEHNLPVGDEYNIPSKTFDSYELNENRLPVNASGTVTEDGDEVIYYYKRIVRIEIVKQDENRVILPGAKLSLYDSSNTLITSWTTTSEAKYITLNPGTYTLKEDITPNNYETANDIEFVINNNGNLIINNSNATKVIMTDNFKKYPYTVNYLEKDTNAVLHAPKTVNEAKYSSKIKANDEIIDIDNYEYDSADKNEMIIGASNNVINLYYSRLKGKVIEKHIYENTNTILYEEEHTLSVGDEYNIPSKTFENYELNTNRLPTNATGIVTEETKEVIYYYRRIVSVGIEKQEETGEKLSGAKLSLYDSNDTLITSWTTTNETKYITLNPGTYTLKEEITPSNFIKASDIEFVIDNDGNIIVNNSGVEKIIMIDNSKKYPYTVNYFDKDTNHPIHLPKTVNDVKITTKIKTIDEIINISHYRYDSSDKDELIISEGDNVINLYYERIQGGIVEKHIDENTGAILYEEEHNLPVGEEYNIPSKTFDNYVLNSDRLPENATGTVTEDGDEVIYYYRRIVRVEIVKQDEKGVILPGAKLSLYNSSNTLITSWTTTNEAKYITLNPGTYTLKEEITPANYEKASDIEFIIDNNGNIKVNNVNVEKIIMVDNYQKYSYTVNYFDKDTNHPIHLPKTVNDVKYTTKIKASDEVISINNYRYNSANPLELIISESGNVINLYYDRIMGNVIEKHIDENTGTILYEEEHNLPVGEEYNIPSKTFDNYVLNSNRLPENASGTVTEETKEVIYYYQRIVRVGIEKQDEKGAILPGAKLSLYNSSNTLITSWTTTNETKYITLNPGTYTLKEEITPANYEKASDIEFTIDNDGNIKVNNANVDKIIMIDNYQKYAYTVNYFDKDTNEPIHTSKTVNNVKYTTKIKASDEVISISNYRYNSAYPQELIISESNNIINIYYERIHGGIVEKHLDENTNTILYEEEHNLPVGNEYNIPSKTFDNYELNTNRLPENATGTVTEESKEVIYYYRRIKTVEILKQDEKGATLPGAKLSLYNNSNTLISSWTTTNEAKNISLNPGMYTLKEEITPNGYEKASDIEFIIDNDGNIKVNNANVDKIIMIDNYEKYAYTVNYLDKETNEPIHTSKTVNNVKFTTKIKASDEVISINNYRYNSANPLELIIGESGNIINLYYDRIKGSVIEKHLDENTGAILYEEEHLLSAGDEYNIPSKMFDNYELNTNRLPENATGIVTEESIEVIYYYRRITNVEIIKQNEDGENLLNAKLSLYNNNNTLITSWTTTNEAKTLSLNPGTYILKEEITPNGYEKSIDIEFIIDNDGNVIVNGINTSKIVMIDRYQKCPYTINYLDRETNEPIHDPKIITDARYNTKIKASDETINITNYIFKYADKEEVTIDLNDNVINLYYERIKGGIVEKHIDENGNIILQEKVHTLLVGDEYNITSKTFDKYVLMKDKLPTNSKGIVQEETQEVIYYYRKLVNVITKVKRAGGTIEGDETVLEKDDSTPNKIVIKADEDHYIEKVTINGKEIAVTDKTTMILENFISMDEDKIVEVSFGDIIKDVPKTDKNTILPIISIIVLIIGIMIIVIQTKKINNF